MRLNSTAALIDSASPVRIRPGPPVDRHGPGRREAAPQFGHHSGNHPVRDERSGKISITAQNHITASPPSSLNPDEVEVTHLSLNDGSLEGLRMRRKPVFSVQYHPEAAPGPHDAHLPFL
jgi:carbamoyl-phosphate synthase small subunit